MLTMRIAVLFVAAPKRQGKKKMQSMCECDKK
uniref:Uncharacterized protein n=1 Tax=viral metagenome TaxID=1070528 RepID=A0A6C0KGF4_9ZZZZ